MSHALRHLTRLGLAPKGAIHVGANSGQEVDAYREAGIDPALFFEALPAPYERLKVKIGQGTNYVPINACLSDAAGKSVEFNVASNGGQSSSYLKPTGHKELYARVTFDDTVSLTTSTLDKEIKRWAEETGRSAEELDYMALDVQGAEMDVLKGSTETLATVKYIWTEVSFGGLYEGDPSLYEMIDFMRGVGFDLYQLGMTKRRWGDALFIRPGVVPLD